MVRSCTILLILRHAYATLNHLSCPQQSRRLSSVTMQSLRTRRPAERAPSQKTLKQQPSKLAKATTTKRTTSRKSRVDDKIKKRMSMRYADISGPTDASVPPMPSLPIGASRSTGRDDEDDEAVREPQILREETRDMDMQELERDNFDPDACMFLLDSYSTAQVLIGCIVLRVKLANSNEAEITSMQSSLQSYKDDTNIDLQRNVFKKCVCFLPHLAVRVLKHLLATPNS